MITKLFNLKWLALIRSFQTKRSIGTIFLYLFIGIYFIVIYSSASIFLIHRLPENGITASHQINNLLFYYLVFDILLRLFFQPCPEFQRQLLLLNIRRKTLVRFTLIHSIFHFLNLLPLFLFLPVFIKKIYPQFPVTGWIWLVDIGFLILGSHFLTRFLKWIDERRPKTSFAIGAFLIALVACSWFQLIPLDQYIGNYFSELLIHPFESILLFIVVGLIIQLSYRTLFNLSKDDLISKNKTHHQFSGSAFLKKGKYNQLIILHIRLILRNKKLKSQLIAGLLFLLYGLLIYPQKGNGDTYFMLGALIIPSIFPLGLMGFFPIMHSDYFQLISSSPFKLKDFLNSFYILIGGSYFIFFLFSLIYSFWYPQVLIYNSAFFLYNIGVNLHLLLLISVNNRTKVSLNTSGMFQRQPGAFKRVISVLIYFAIPSIIFRTIHLFENQIISLIIIASIGLVGLLIHSTWIKWSIQNYKQKKYLLIEAFK